MVPGPQVTALYALFAGRGCGLRDAGSYVVRIPQDLC
jgi:hypothetical protein